MHLFESHREGGDIADNALSYVHKPEGCKLWKMQRFYKCIDKAAMGLMFAEIDTASKRVCVHACGGRGRSEVIYSNKENIADTSRP